MSINAAVSIPDGFYFEQLLSHFQKLMEVYQTQKEKKCIFETIRKENAKKVSPLRKGQSI